MEWGGVHPTFVGVVWRDRGPKDPTQLTQQVVDDAAVEERELGRALRHVHGFE
jgi:hypothetical protein